jgi:hypothetical protein
MEDWVLVITQIITLVLLIISEVLPLTDNDYVGILHTILQKLQKPDSDK